MSVASSALLAGLRRERRRSGERLRKDSVIRRTYQENGKTADERAELIDWRFEKLVSNEII